MTERWRFSLGEVNSQYGQPHRDRRFPADHKKNYVRYSNFHQKLRNKRLSMMWTNFWCRDQNFRKYFELRKRHGLKPSLSGFAHEKIYKDTEARNIAFAKMKATRAAA